MESFAGRTNSFARRRMWLC